MTTRRINDRIRFLIKWSPLFFITAAVWAFLAWRHSQLSIGYFLAYIGIGLLCGLLIILGFWKNISFLAYVLWYMVFISAPMFVGAVLFSNFNSKMTYQYLSVVAASILGLFVVFRGRLMKWSALDAEQIVGREPRERVSQEVPMNRDWR